MRAATFVLTSLLSSPVPVGFTPAQHRADQLKAFIDATHAELQQSRPDLFRLKMEKAAASEKAFYRAFPNLFYSKLKTMGDFESAASAVEVRNAGDIHADNVEVEDYQGKPVPVVNDFDDSGKAPASLDAARMLGAAALLDNDEQGRRDKIEQARAGYRAALRKDFDSWAQSLKAEAASRGAETSDQKWPERAGPPVTDRRLAAKLHREAGLDPKEWKLHDRAGSGLSSIGMRRYMFVSEEKGFVWELKQLRSSALEFFTGKAMSESDRQRLQAAFEEIRKTPSKVLFLTFDGVDWLLRRREPQITRLDFESKSSASRVLGGMTAQMHLASAAPAELNKAIASVSTDAVMEAVDFMADMRRSLRKLLKEGAWKAE